MNSVPYHAMRCVCVWGGGEILGRQPDAGMESKEFLCKNRIQRGERMFHIFNHGVSACIEYISCIQ